MRPISAQPSWGSGTSTGFPRVEDLINELRVAEQASPKAQTTQPASGSLQVPGSQSRIQEQAQSLVRSTTARVPTRTISIPRSQSLPSQRIFPSRAALQDSRTKLLQEQDKLLLDLERLPMSMQKSRADCLSRLSLIKIQLDIVQRAIIQTEIQTELPKDSQIERSNRQAVDSNAIATQRPREKEKRQLNRISSLLQQALFFARKMDAICKEDRSMHGHTN